MKLWQYCVIAAAVLIVCAVVGTVIDHALIPPHSWVRSARKGISILVGGVAGAAILRLITRHHH